MDPEIAERLALTKNNQFDMKAFDQFIVNKLKYDDWDDGVMTFDSRIRRQLAKEDSALRRFIEDAEPPKPLFIRGIKVIR